MLRSFSSTSTASDEEAALDAAPGSASATTSAAAPARSQVPRRSIAHNPSFLLEAGYSGASGSSPRGKGGPGQASSSAGPPPPSPGLGGAPADWDEVDLEFDVDLEMARGESGGGAGGKGTPGRGGRDRSSRGGEGEQVPMQKLGSGSGRLKMARGGSQIHRPTIMEEQGEVAVGAGSAPSSMSEYDATPKPSMDVHPPPIREEDEGSAQSLLGQHRRTTSTSSSQGKLSKARLLDNDGNEAVHRHQENSIQPRPPSYTPRAPGHDDSALEENEDEDEDGETPTARHIDRSYLDPGEGMGSARRLDFEPLTRREKWAYAVTALVVAVLAGLAVAIGGDLVGEFAAHKCSESEGERLQKRLDRLTDCAPTLVFCPSRYLSLCAFL